MASVPKLTENSTFCQKLTSDNFIVLSIVLSVIFYWVGIVTDSDILDALVTILGGFSIGYAVNRYTEMFKNKTEIENLSEKTFDQTYNIVNQLLTKSKTSSLTENEVSILKQLTLILVSLRKHHDFDEHIIWRELKDMEKEPEKWQIPNLGQTSTFVTNGPIDVYKDVMKTLSHEYRTASGSQAPPTTNP